MLQVNQDTAPVTKVFTTFFRAGSIEVLIPSTSKINTIYSKMG